MPARSSPRTRATPSRGGSDDVDLDHVRRAGDVHRRARGDHDAVAGSRRARPRARSRPRVPEILDVPASAISSGATPHSSASCRIAQPLCVSATIGRRGRSRATSTPSGREKSGRRSRSRAAPRRCRTPRSTSPGRSSARRARPAAGGGSPGSARPRARSGPCTPPPRPGTRRPPSRPRASPRRCRRGSRSRRRSPRRASARRACTIDSSICVAVITGFPRSSALQDDPLLQRAARAPGRSRRRGRRARPSPRRSRR